MANVASELFAITGEALAHLDAISRALKIELLDIETRVREIERQLRVAGDGRKRLLNFTPTLGGKVQCPSCYACDGTHHELTLIRNSTNEQLLRCRACGFQLSVCA